MNLNIAPQFAQMCERMRAIAWFSSVGEQTELTLPYPSRLIRDAGEAHTVIERPAWENWTLERRNDTTAYLYDRFKNRYEQWNKIADVARSYLKEELAPHMLPALSRALPQSKVAVGCVRWDLLGALMEMAYADCCPPTFFTDLIKVYEAGHLPVGWDEASATGTLLVY